jgi:hypothetical protein
MHIFYTRIVVANFQHNNIHKLTNYIAKDETTKYLVPPVVVEDENVSVVVLITVLTSFYNRI